MTNTIKTIISTANEDEEITKLYLFGSHARGTATAFSDIDIAVIHKDTTKVNRAALNKIAELSDLDVEYSYIQAHVFDTDNHPLHISSSIKKEGVLLWQR